MDHGAECSKQQYFDRADCWIDSTAGLGPKLSLVDNVKPPCKYLYVGHRIYSRHSWSMETDPDLEWGAGEGRTDLVGAGPIGPDSADHHAAATDSSHFQPEISTATDYYPGAAGSTDC
ncbi:hypothetical protein HPG69_009691 [Diceros bicornis minor]|uniref:Uncharacterized protein n=1 Tax=Diceros bicornis minor TaxID=77932 RepID=A0A7J7EXA4_DICBM|nr:hypothetical protein HPG69_009691 [Diceros bicornis minor]